MFLEELFLLFHTWVLQPFYPKMWLKRTYQQTLSSMVVWKNCKQKHDCCDHLINRCLFFFIFFVCLLPEKKKKQHSILSFSLSLCEKISYMKPILTYAASWDRDQRSAFIGYDQSHRCPHETSVDYPESQQCYL